MNRQEALGYRGGADETAEMGTKEEQKVDLPKIFLFLDQENFGFFSREMNKALEHFYENRKQFYGEDGKKNGKYGLEELTNETYEKIEKVVGEMQDIFDRTHTPWEQDLYMAHMNSETIFGAILANFVGLLYNTNNVAYESSIPTAIFEKEAVGGLIDMLGLKRESAWGYIALDGTIANDESLWLARALKSFPLAMADYFAYVTKADCDAIKEMKLGKIKNLLERDLAEADLVEKNPLTGNLLEISLGSDKIKKPKDMEGSDILWKLQNISLDHISEMIMAVREYDNAHKGDELVKKWIKEHDPVQLRSGTSLFEQILNHSVRGTGDTSQLGKVIAPVTAHYSVQKGADILGIGTNNLIHIDVDSKYRMDIEKLDNYLEYALAHKIPIISVTAVIGSTEEGAVDKLNKILDIKGKYRKLGLNFYLHVDAAYGGYMRTLFLKSKGLDKDGKPLKPEFIKTYEKAKVTLSSLVRDGACPSEEVYKAFKAISAADSVTIDPHKLGFVPYVAGGFITRNKAFVELLQYSPTYLFNEKKNVEFIGKATLEGSRAGASSAAVWFAHKLLPLNLNGYGELMANLVSNTRYLLEIFDKVFNKGGFEVEGHKITFAPVVKSPDLNIMLYAFNIEGNADLEKTNAFNKKIHEMCTFKSEPSGGPEYDSYKRTKQILADNTLTFGAFGDTPKTFVKSLLNVNDALAAAEWARVGEAYTIRSVLMHPLKFDQNESELGNGKAKHGGIFGIRLRGSKHKGDHHPSAEEYYTQHLKGAIKEAFDSVFGVPATSPGVDIVTEVPVRHR